MQTVAVKSGQDVQEGDLLIKLNDASDVFGVEPTGAANDAIANGIRTLPNFSI